jgi:heptaprenyl diphosphate synthase
MSAKTLARMALLSSVMLVLSYIERQIPAVSTIPGVKLGLANTVLLFAICLMRPKDAWTLMVIKVGIAGLVYLNGLAMLYSLAGGVLSLIAMYGAKRLPGLSIVGVSIIGALMHIAGQLAVAAWTLHTQALLAILPVYMALSAVTGLVTGIAAKYVNAALEKSGWSK